MEDLRLDGAVSERMGYEEIVSATSLDDGQIEFALVAPGSHLSPDEWVVVIHYDCDPEDDARGASAVEPCGPDRRAAEEYYVSRIAEHRESLRIDREIASLNDARPAAFR